MPAKARHDYPSRNACLIDLPVSGLVRQGRSAVFCHYEKRAPLSQGFSNPAQTISTEALLFYPLLPVFPSIFGRAVRLTSY
jgi:hypothetical protein